MEHLDLILTAIGCTASATAAVVWAIAGVKQALAVHVAEDRATHEKQGAEILQLKARRRK